MMEIIKYYRKTLVKVATMQMIIMEIIGRVSVVIMYLTWIKLRVDLISRLKLR